MPEQDILELVDELVKEAKRCNQRRLIVIADKRERGIALLQEILSKVQLSRKITFAKTIDFKVPGEIEELKNSEKYLGTNYELLAMDLHHSFIPNDLGKLINIVEGGGLIILLTPPFENWPKMRNFFHEVILTPPIHYGRYKGKLCKMGYQKIERAQWNNDNREWKDNKKGKFELREER